MLLKPTGVAVAGALAIVLAIRHRRNLSRLSAHAAAMVVGHAIPLGARLAYLMGADILRDMPDLDQQIARYAAGTLWQTEEWLKLPIVLAMIGFPFVVHGFIGRKHARVENLCYFGVWHFLLLWLALEGHPVRSADVQLTDVVDAARSPEVSEEAHSRRHRADGRARSARARRRLRARANVVRECRPRHQSASGRRVPKVARAATHRSPRRLAGRNAQKRALATRGSSLRVPPRRKTI